jgi:hypothetical protein
LARLPEKASESRRFQMPSADRMGGATIFMAPSAQMVAVAQLVEHLVVVQDVAGSNPVGHPRIFRPEMADPTGHLSVTLTLHNEPMEVPEELYRQATRWLGLKRWERREWARR